MKILLTGATGFIGRRLLAALRGGGHVVMAAGRGAAPEASTDWVEMDFTALGPQPRWAAQLSGVDVVVNSIGLFRETGRQTFRALHVDGPKALFDACVEARVKRVIQLSALGVESGVTEYQRSKKEADDYLLALPLDAVVVRPSLVFGSDGQSAALFLALASLPLLPLPEGGRQMLRPVHVDDAVQVLMALVEGHGPQGCVALVGPRAMPLMEYLQALREALGLPRAAAFAVPAVFVDLGARLAERLPGSLFDRASLKMLRQGNTADVAQTARLLGRLPREPRDFLAADPVDALRRQARLGWLIPLMRLSIALVWIATSIVSFGVYPVHESFALLARTGVPQPLRPLLLYGAASLDMLLGVLTLWPLRPAWRRRLWLTQIGLILCYTLVITVKLPEFWLHPYGPLTKNLPMLALLAMLAALEPRDGDRRWST